jgi:hypothetical protein
MIVIVGKICGFHASFNENLSIGRIALERHMFYLRGRFLSSAYLPSPDHLITLLSVLHFPV